MGDPLKEQPETVKIPLDQIWAYKMPGTRKIEKFAGLADLKLLGSIFESQVLRAERLKFKDVARPGFAVSGSGQVALRAAHAVFVKGKTPRAEFSPNDQIVIVFFSEPHGGNQVRIEQVERQGDHIEIQYRLEPYFERSLSETFALIPLGKMTVGKYRVEMRQLPREQKFIHWGYQPLDKKWSCEVLCRAFNFIVTEKRE